MINRVGIIYAAAMVLAAAASFGKWFLFARILGADAFSYYALLDIVASYGVYLGGLGLFEGASRTVPILRGSGRVRAARTVGARATGAILMLGGVGLCFFVPIVWFAVDDARLAGTLIAGGIFAIANNLFLMGAMLILTFDRPLAFALVMLAKNFGALLLGTLLGLEAGLPGVIAAEIGTTSVLAIVALVLGRTLVAFHISRLARLKGVFRVGLPLLGVSLTQNLTRNIDRLAAGAALGIYAFGQYTFALTIAMAGMIALNIVTQYVSPKILFAHGAKRDVDRMVRLMDMLVLALLALAGIALVPIAWLVNTYGILLFPDFDLGLSLMPIAYLGAVLQIAQLYQIFLIARGEGWRLMWQGVAVCAIAAVVCVVGIVSEASPTFFVWVFVGHRLLAAIMLRSAVSRPLSARDRGTESTTGYADTLTLGDRN